MTDTERRILAMARGEMEYQRPNLISEVIELMVSRSTRDMERAAALIIQELNGREGETSEEDQIGDELDALWRRNPGYALKVTFAGRTGKMFRLSRIGMTEEMMNVYAGHIGRKADIEAGLEQIAIAHPLYSFIAEYGKEGGETVQWWSTYIEFGKRRKEKGK